MKKIIIMLFFFSSLVVVFFCASQGQNAFNNVTDPIVSNNKVIQKKEENIFLVTVVDDKGNSRKLTMGAVDTEDVGLYFQSAYYVTDYSQVSEGHYYYIRCKNGNEYTIYQDKGKKVGKFKLEYFDPYAILRSGDHFYLLIQDYEDIDEEKIAYVDLQKGEVVILGDIADNCVAENNFIVFYAIYQGNLYYSPEIFKSTGGIFTKSDLKQMDSRIALTTTSAMDKARPRLTFMDGNIFYAVQDGKNVTLYEYDLDTAVEREIFCYQRNDDKKMDKILLEIDNDYIYCQDYLIPRQGGKMIQAFKEAKVFDHGEISYAHNKDYIFYIDKIDRVRRIDKRSGKDTIINKKQFKKVDCTKNTIYAIACDPPLRDYLVEDPGHFSNDLYCMDLDGKNVKKLWKGGIEEE